MISLVIIILFFSTILMFTKRFINYFNFLPGDFMIISIIGLIAILCSVFTEVGEKKIIKCYLKTIYLSFGFTLHIIPILYKLIINFPEENKITEWICKHKYLFFLLFIFFDLLIIILLYLTSSYTIELHKILDGKNFEICAITNKLSKIIRIINILIKIFILMVILIFIYIEWNREDSYKGIRFLVSAIYTDILSIILWIVINFLNINSYQAYFILYECIFLLFSIFNFICIYGIRFIWAFTNKDNNQSLFIKNVNKNFIDSTQKGSKCYSYNEDTSIDDHNKNNSSTMNCENTEVYNKSPSKRRFSNIPNIIIKLNSYHNSKCSSTKILDESSYTTNTSINN